MAIKFIIFATLAVSCALALPGYHNPHAHAVDYYDHPHYSFNYGVTDHHTGDIKSQSEYRDGGVVKGQYSLVEPDGSIRTVDYTADDINGFNAVVTKTGPNVHAAKVVAPVAPIVHKPIIAHKQVLAPAPIVYKAAPAPLVTVAKSAQYTHHAPALNHYDYADYGHYDASHYDAGHYY